MISNNNIELKHLKYLIEALHGIVCELHKPYSSSSACSWITTFLCYELKTKHLNNITKMVLREICIMIMMYDNVLTLCIECLDTTENLSILTDMEPSFYNNSDV